MVPVALLRLSAAAAGLAALPARAHHAEGSAPGAAWNLDPVVLLPLVAAALLYFIGVRRLWRRAGRGRGVSVSEASRFGAGWGVLAIALVSPLDGLGEALFSAHMAQHELLMTLAAPLLVLGRPIEAWTWGLAPAWRGPLAELARAPAIEWPLAFASRPLSAWLLHATAIWAWHVPAFFEAALRDPGVHALQHASFLGTAILFWWSVFGRGIRKPDSASVAGVFTTMLHSGGLGALLTFAPTVWYVHYASTTFPYGLTALEDQQLGGLVMWGPGGLPYLAIGLAIVGAWLARGRSAAAAFR
ncbi:MAG TPA: cytochrome c oxidase assembly protein [Usitatibacter sp.]|nr:cytochrome c oxidase assembly protein [Usitatibacter sp.]